MYLLLRLRVTEHDVCGTPLDFHVQEKVDWGKIELTLYVPEQLLAL